MSRRRAKRNSVLSILILEVGSLLGIVSIAQPNATRDIFQQAFRSIQAPSDASTVVADSSLPTSTVDVAQQPWWSYRLNEREGQSNQVPGVGDVGSGNGTSGEYVGGGHVDTDLSHAQASGVQQLPSVQASGEVNWVDQAAYLSARRLQQSLADGVAVNSPTISMIGSSDRFSSNDRITTSSAESKWRSSVPVAAPNYYY